MRQSSKRLMKSLAKHFPKDRWFNVLDVGAMNKSGGAPGSYKNIFTLLNCDYTGMDIAEGNNVDIVCPEPYNWKEIEDSSFDVVISGQCMEHVPMPWLWIKEVARVVKPGGTVIVIAPWQWEPHYYPLDCWRVLPDGMQGLFDWAGLEMVETEMSEFDTYGVGVKK